MTTLAEVATKAFKLRDAIEQKESAFKQEMKSQKALLEQLENWLLAQLEAQGTQRIAVTGVGTVYRKKETSVKVADWDVVWEWMQANERYDLLNHAVNKTATIQHIEDTGNPPPGIDYTTFYSVGMQSERKS